MQDIADKVGITKAALYYHFDSKDTLTEELLREAVEDLKKELLNTLKSSVLPSDALFNIIKTFLDFKINHPEISLLTTIGSGSDERIPMLAFVSELRHELIKFVRELVEGIDITRKFTYQTLFVITTSIISVTLSPFIQSGDKETQQTAEDLSKLFSIPNKNVEQIAE